MKRVRPNDYYSTSRISLFSYIDVKLLSDLYLPLIGANALSVFLRLEEDPTGKDPSVVTTHKSLFYSLRLSAGEFEAAITSLEAVGLVKTYLSYGEEASYFCYALNSPLSPNKFFDDPLLYGTLLKYVGEEETNRLKQKYKQEEPFKGMEDVSTSFNEHFRPNLNESYYSGSTPNMKGRKYAKAKIDFDRDLFDKEWKSLGNNQRLSDKERDRIEKIATLYGIDSKLAATLAYESFDFVSGKNVFIEDKFLEKCILSAPFSYLSQIKGEKSSVSGETVLAQKVRLMDNLPPAQFLSMLQKGHKPAQADLRLLSKLALEIGLPNGVINVLIDYTLQKNDNVLSATYVEKVGASLVREDCKSARDAMEYFKSLSKKKKDGPKKKESPKAKANDDNALEIASEEEENAKVDAMLDAIFLDLDKKNNED